MSLLNKTPLKSKKFIAFFFALLVLASVLIFALKTQVFGWAIALFMCIGIFAIAFLAVSYIGKQGDIDKFIGGVTTLKGIGEAGETPKDPME
jgi:hypothetical protein